MLSKKYMTFFIVVVIMFFVLVPAAQSAVFNVTNPTELQDALNTAKSNGQDDTLNVLAGTYNITTTLAYSPALTENFKLEITGAGAGSTILDGGVSVQILNISTKGLTSDSLAHISINGITFKNGNNSSGRGGGLAVTTDYANITVQHLEFSKNSASPGGGGAYINSSFGTINLASNTFSGNATDSYGSGGGANVSSSSGTITLASNTFSGNTTGSYTAGGGASVNSSSGAITLANNTFSGNTTYYFGGGAYVYSGSGKVAFVNNTFSSNIATYGLNSDGGGAYVNSSSGAVSLTNNTFTGNTVNHYGSGAFVNLNNDTAAAHIYNNILHDNSASAGGNDGDDLYVNSDGNNNSIGSLVSLYNNDLGVNTEFITAMSEDLVVTDIDNYSQGSNIKADCLLTADFHLQTGSPCIDKGTNTAPSLPTIDFEGDLRIINSIVDIGADEYSVNYPLGDINNDGIVDISDVILVLRCALYLPINPYQCLPCGDINGDGVIDISDVILTLRMALGLDSLKQCT